MERKITLFLQRRLRLSKKCRSPKGVSILGTGTGFGVGIKNTLRHPPFLYRLIHWLQSGFVKASSSCFFFFPSDSLTVLYAFALVQQKFVKQLLQF